VSTPHIPHGRRNLDLKDLKAMGEDAKEERTEGRRMSTRKKWIAALGLTAAEVP